MWESGHAVVDNHEGMIVGSDEVGYGCMAGPLLVVATALPRAWFDKRVTDSKAFKGELGKAKREALHKEFSHHPLIPSALVIVTVDEIDSRGVYPSLLTAHQNALNALIAEVGEDCLAVIDGSFPIHRVHVDAPVVCVPKGDLLVPACALASIIAKVTRDNIMKGYAKQYPGYGFERHVGYVTKEHKAALEKLGPCDIHRRSYAPVAQVIAKKATQD